MRRGLASLAALGLAACAASGPNDPADTATHARAAAEGTPAAAGTPDPRLDWWREARFGLFLHWGLYAIPAGEWGGGTDHAEWIRTTAEIPVEEYEHLRERFDPVGFDADAWARMAADAGMRYVVITTKHHDGFCLFDSAVTDWDVMSTPWRRDVMAELAEACRRHGLRMGWYHSIMDWHHPDYLPRRGWEDRPTDGADMDRFVRYLHAQVEELLTKYGDIGVMWFDGEWESTWSHERGQALYDLCRRLQPDVIVNNRVDVGRGGMAGMTTGAGYAGDYGTPEQEIPPTGLPGVDWETCMTMNDHWGWNRADRAWKSPAELVRILVDVASKGGNLLLNVGPRADGTFPPEAVERLAAIGRWMRANGAAIHGTTAGPFEALDFGRCTRGEEGGRTRLFLHVFDWPADGALVVPNLGTDPARAFLLDGGAELSTRRGPDGALRVSLPGAAPDPLVTVVALEFEGEPVVYRTPTIEAAAPIFVEVLDVALDARSPGVELRATVDGSEPTLASPRCDGALRLTGTALVRVRGFDGGRPVTAVVERRFERVPPLAATDATPQGAGLQVYARPGDFDALPDFDAWLRTVRVAARTVPGPVLERDLAVERLAVRFDGLLEVPADDVYTFWLTSDDGSRLELGERVVVDNDGLHSSLTRSGSIALARGLHAVRVEWFNKTGGAELALEWARLGQPRGPIPVSVWHRR